MKRNKSSWLDSIFGQFLRESTIQGVKYIGGRERNGFERFFWIIAVLSSLGYSCYLVEEVYRKYYKNPVIISFQAQETAVSRIPFPAITICNINVLKRDEMLKVLEKIMDEDEFMKQTGNWKESVNYVSTLAEHLAHYCLAASSFRRLLEARLVDSYGQEDFVDFIHNTLLGFKEKGGTKDYNETLPEVHRNISQFTHKATHSCDDMILKCLWAREEINCSDIFSPLYTQHGSCCVFNMMPKYILRNRAENETRAIREKKRLSKRRREEWEKYKGDKVILDNEKEGKVRYPKYQKQGGKPYGLSLLINPELHTYGTCNSNDGYGFKIAAHSPISYPNIADYGVIIPADSEAFLSITPEVTTANRQDLGRYVVEKRECYFPTDHQSKLQSYKFYSADNCMDECVARITFRNCGCVRYFMPKNSTQPLCKASKLQCAEDVRKNLTNSGRKDHCTSCRPACSDIDYRIQVSQFPLRESGSTILYNTSTETNKSAVKPSIVHVFYGTDSIYAKERKVLYDTSDLLANAGGLLGLTLGFSIISLIEIIYFFTIRAFFKRREDKEKEDDEDFYTRSSYSGGPRLSAIVRPRILEGLQQKNMNTSGFYHWAVKASSNGIAEVDCSSTDLPNRIIPRRRGQNFDLLSGNYGKAIHPYYS